MTERKTSVGIGALIPVIELQWGRSDDGAEDGRGDGPETEDAEMLQWGRSDDGAEDTFR